jgi:translation initiation factor 2 beta subunit (eIF-2beta)/eIF-5
MNLRSLIRCGSLTPLLVCLFVFSMARITVYGQQPPAVPESTTSETELLTPEKSQERQAEIKQKLAALESSGLSEEDRKKAAEFYQKALNALASVEEYRGQLALHQRESAEYNEELKQYEEKLANLTNTEPVINPEADLTKLQQDLAAQDQVVQSAQADLDRSEQQLKNRQARLADIPQQTVERQQELEKVTTQFEAAAAKDATDVLAGAERDYLWARAEALKMSLAEMAEQRQYFTMSPDLAQVRRDFRAKYLTQQQKQLAALRQALDDKRIAEAEAQADEAARTAAVERPAAIAELANSNKVLADEQARIAEKNADLTKEDATIKKQQQELADEFDWSRNRVDQAGSTEVGQELRRQQELLPDLSAIARRMALGTQEKEAIGYRYLELMERRANLADADRDERVAEILQ